MVISTPRLCNDVAFQPPKASKPHAIPCTPVLPEADIPAFLADMEAAQIELEAKVDVFVEEEIKAYLTNGDPPPKTRPRIFVGDVEVGAHAVVPPGKKIEKSVVVGGGKETLIATIAKSDGYMASEADMKRVGIRTHREVEGVKKEIERVAGGKPWRLDVVDTPRGKELRGVVEEDAKDEKSREGGSKIKKKQDTEKKVDGVKKDKDVFGDSKGKPEKEKVDESEEGTEETYKEEL
jgi:protein OS-9